MKKYLSIIIIILICIITYGCESGTKVTFNYNCSGVKNYSCPVTNKKLDCTFTLPSCENKTFIGWFDARENGNRVNLDRDFEQNTTVYAHWEEKEKEPNIPDEPDVPDEPDSPDTPDTPDYPDEPEEPDVPEEPVKDTYTVTFSLNGGTGSSVASVEARYGEIMPEIDRITPTKKEYIFMGFYDNIDYTKGKAYYGENCESIRYYDLEKDLTLYAGWKKEEKQEEKEYTIYFNANGGSGGQTSSVKAKYGNKLPEISTQIPTRSGYTFVGYYDNADYTKGTQYYTSSSVATRVYNKEADTTLYAGWSKVIVVESYKVTFNINGGVGNVPKETVGVKGSAMPSITTIVPTRSGYTFMGWYDNADYTKGVQYYNNKNESARSFDKSSNTTLYAGWKQEIYKLSFNLNGGTGVQISSSTLKYGDKLPTIGSTTPTKDGYEFMGWYDNATYTKGTQYYTVNNTTSKTFDKKNDLVLYAGWKVKTYKDPIKPPSTDNVINSEETDTLKVYISKTSSYYLTRVWAKDPYTQLNKQNAEPYGKNLYKPSVLLTNAMNEKNLTNKLMVGFNASGFYLKDVYDASSVNYYPAFNKTSVGTLVITDGKVIRNAYEKGDLLTWFIAGVTKDNKMVVFEDKKMKLTNTAEKKAWSESVIASGIRNTYTFAAPIIENGQKTSYTNENSRMPGSNSSKKGLQLFCQIDENNYAFFTSTSETRNKGISVFLDLGCKTAVNLDGGGSVALLFKSRGSSQFQTIVGNGRNLPEAGYFTE